MVMVLWAGFATCRQHEQGDAAAEAAVKTLHQGHLGCESWQQAAHCRLSGAEESLQEGETDHIDQVWSHPLALCTSEVW